MSSSTHQCTRRLSECSPLVEENILGYTYRKDIKTDVSDQLRPVHGIFKEDIPNPMSSLE